MSDRLFALRLFVRVARGGSFSVAGRAMQLSQPSVSRIISGLEAEVGAALLTRTTRAVSLTEAGSDYLARIEPILAALDEADHAARGTGELRGILRVGVPASLAMRQIIPRLPGFMDLHPGLRVDMTMSDQRQNLVVEGVDVALRFGALPDSSATARKIGTSHRILVASPSYLQRAGVPVSPAELPSHSIVVGPAAMAGWIFQREGRETSVDLDGRLVVNVNEAAATAAVSGLGIACLGRWGCQEEISQGTLVHILPEWALEPMEVNAVFAAGRAAKPSARAFVDYLAKNLVDL
ncbi:LysR family transcriptional regulator [Cupriavidus pauculus]|uniref:LysR family transcriptional regulator n=1 Tax=Cupriavidus pauculus TaxID=82633 RepID=A0A2N5C9E1_9BURK|nr:LysR family transcriptional regulator [Cupriavidus pauculus]PLP98845.1 LysR family transcriptional regulator [Cupriavidus pauculus]